MSDELKIIGIDLAIDKDKTAYIAFKNESIINVLPYKESIRRKFLYQDKAYNKYLKRVINRKKLFEKLKKLGR